MTDPTRRHSRYPAVNRDVPPSVSVEAPKAPVEAPKEPEVVEAVEAPEADPEAEESAVEEEEVVVLSDIAEQELPDISEMSTKKVLAWVGGDDSRRDWAIAAEEAGRDRKGLLSKLQEG